VDLIKPNVLFWEVKALHLFHCQGQSMGEIAPQIGLQAQFQVTRLMKLKEFRTSVRSKLLQMLLESVIDKAKTYADPSHLQHLNQQIEADLNEDISIIMQQSEAEAAVAKHCPLRSLFAQRLCDYLNTRRVAP
jgi:predicted RNase H-like nuclease